VTAYILCNVTGFVPGSGSGCVWRWEFETAGFDLVEVGVD
jgi:hypothetical protein